MVEADAIFPNAIILALSSRARFVQSRDHHVSDGIAAGGTIEIPIRTGQALDGPGSSTGNNAPWRWQRPASLTSQYQSLPSSLTTSHSSVTNSSGSITRDRYRAKWSRNYFRRWDRLFRRVTPRQVPARLCDAFNLDDAPRSTA